MKQVLLSAIFLALSGVPGSAASAPGAVSGLAYASLVDSLWIAAPANPPLPPVATEPARCRPAGETRLSLEEAQKKLEYFNYLKTDMLSVKRSAPVSHGSYTVEIIAMRVNDPLRQLGEFRQEFQFYKSARRGPRPTVLVFPPFSGAGYINSWVSEYFARKGYNTVVVVPSEDITDVTRPLEKGDDVFIRNTIMARMGIDMLETFPDIDKDRLYAFGISMGGISTSIAFGVEPRIKKAAEMVGGGDIPGVLVDTDYYKLKNLRDARMKIEGIKTLEALRTYLKKTIVIDPLDFGVLREPEDILMVMGHGDTFVPDIYQEKLYDAFSRPLEGRHPVRIDSNWGHVITTLSYKKHIDRVVEFFYRHGKELSDAK
jgi:hypothetical protein